MTAAPLYTSESSMLAFAPTSETSAALLTQNVFRENEGQVIIASAESPLMQIIENKKTRCRIQILDLNGPIAPDFIDFFDGVSQNDIPQVIDSLFLLDKQSNCDHLTAMVLYAAAYYANATSAHITVEQICNIAQLFFTKPLGDEDEYANRLDEVIEVYLTGVHIAGGNHKQIEKPHKCSYLTNIWSPIRAAFGNKSTLASVGAKLTDALHPYSGKCMLDRGNKLIDLRRGNAALAIVCPDYDRTNDRLFMAIMDRPFATLCAKGDEAPPQPKTTVRVIAEECDTKPAIWRLASIAKSAAWNNIKLNLHYSSVSAFRRMHGELANEIMEAFDSLAFLNPSEPAAMQEVQLRTGLSMQELHRTASNSGWLFRRGKTPQRIIANSKEAA